MLMVSDLLEVARHSVPAEQVHAKAPLRFGASRGEGRGPQVVVWNVNRECNMRCPHCYAAARTQPMSGGLDTNQGKALLDGLSRHGVRVVIFSGGEPLLREDLFDLIAHARSAGLTAHLSSNGSLIDRGTAQKLAAAGIGYVGVSIDGRPAYNDTYRGLENGYALALAGLRHARAAGLRTGMRMTLTRGNRSHLESMVDSALQEGFDRFYVSHLVYAGRGARLIGEDLSPEESRALLLELFALADTLLDRGEPLRIVTGANDSGGPLLLGWVEARYGIEAASRVKALLLRRGGNSAGEGLLNVDALGRVHPDQFWQRAILGDVRRDGWEEILAHPLLAQLRRRETLLQGRCGACRFKPLCRGSHRERALSTTGSPWGPDPACVMRDDELRPPTSAATADQAGTAAATA